MELYEKYKPGFERLFKDSMSQIMSENEFYRKVKKKFKVLDEKIKNLSKAEGQKILQKSTIAKIQKVHNRILLVRDLREKIAKSDNITQSYMYPGLVTYLYLTCFDQLGTPVRGWHFFPDWIVSRAHRAEVEEIIDKSRNKVNINSIDEIKCMVKKIYKKYHTIYGVKNSFYRFIREVIPKDTRYNLLNSILVKKWIDTNIQVFDFNVDEVYKEKWLFNTRNNYTHNLFTTQTNLTNGKQIGNDIWMERERILTDDGCIFILVLDNFESILENTIIQAIKVLIEKE